MNPFLLKLLLVRVSQNSAAMINSFPITITDEITAPQSQKKKKYSGRKHDSSQIRGIMLSSLNLCKGDSSNSLCQMSQAQISVTTISNILLLAFPCTSMSIIIQLRAQRMMYTQKSEHLQCCFQTHMCYEESIFHKCNLHTYNIRNAYVYNASRQGILWT